MILSEPWMDWYYHTYTILRYQITEIYKLQIATNYRAISSKYKRRKTVNILIM